MYHIYGVRSVAPQAARLYPVVIFAVFPEANRTVRAQIVRISDVPQIGEVGILLKICLFLPPVVDASETQVGIELRCAEFTVMIAEVRRAVKDTVFMSPCTFCICSILSARFSISLFVIFML